jgi:uncharacterized protein
MAGSFFVSKSTRERFRFDLRAGNDEHVLKSETYDSKADALDGIESVRTNSQNDTRFDRRTVEDGGYYFVLKAANGEAMGTSNIYTSAARMEKGINWVKTTAPSAGIIDKTRELDEYSQHRSNSTTRVRNATRSITLVWAPDVLSPDEYAALVVAIGDIARSEGAAGLQRILSETVGVTADVGALT